MCEVNGIRRFVIGIKILLNPIRFDQIYHVSAIKFDMKTYMVFNIKVNRMDAKIMKGCEGYFLCLF